MTEFVTAIKKNGAVGVLAMWLWYTHNEVQDLKLRLYDCYGKEDLATHKQNVNDSVYAVIPKDELNEE